MDRRPEEEEETPEDEEDDSPGDQPPPPPPGSKRGSTESSAPPPPGSKRGSLESNAPPGSKRGSLESNAPPPPPGSKRGSLESNAPPPPESKRGSLESNAPPLSKRGSLESNAPPQSKRGSLESNAPPPPPESKRGSLESNAPPGSKRGSLESNAPPPPPESKRGSLESNAPPAPKRGSLESNAPPQSKRGSLESNAPPQSKRGSLESNAPPPPPESKRGSLESNAPPKSKRGSLESNAPPQSKRGSLESNAPPQSKRGSLESNAPPPPPGSKRGSVEDDSTPTDEPPLTKQWSSMADESEEEEGTSEPARSVAPKKRSLLPEELDDDEEVENVETEDDDDELARLGLDKDGRFGSWKKSRGVIDDDDEEEDDFDEEDIDGLLLSANSSKRSLRSTSSKSRPKRVLSSDAESSPASEDEYARPSTPDVPPEYWQVQRLVKYVKAGNPTATIIAMSSLRDFNLRDRYVQNAIKDAGGLEVLLNILETDENRCKIGSLLILREITSNTEISRIVFNMRGIESLINNLRDPAKELKLLSAEVLANISKIRKARRSLRKGDGINRLVDMLDIDIPSNHTWHNMEGELVDFDVPRCGALALWSLSKSTKNKDAIRKAGAIPLIARLLKSHHVAVIIPVVGILHECASEPSFRLAIRTEGLLVDFVEGLRSNNHQLVQFCASAIFMCAEDPESRQIVYDLGAIEPLLNIIRDENLRKNKPLLGAATGAIWKCSSSIATHKKYLDQAFVELLVSLLDDEPEFILANVAGAIEQIIITDEKNALLIKKAGAIPPLIGLLTINNPLLLVNATKAVGQLARDPEARKDMDEQNGFRLVWSLLKHPSPLVQASAAWAICPYVESTPESGDIVRNFVGGLEALVNLLKSDDINVQAAVAQAVSVIAQNMENLAIMSDHGVVPNLAKLAYTKSDLLRRNIADAIAQCCKWKTNSADFGKMKAVSPICTYLSGEDVDVHRAAAKALAALSTDPRNCITMHQCGVVDYLCNMIGSVDLELAQAAAETIYNIRMLAMAAERVRLR